MPVVLTPNFDVVDFEDVQAQVSVASNSTANAILSKTCKNALIPYLAFVGMAWDLTYDTFLTWRVKKDGITIYQLKDSKVQIAPPEQPWQELTPWLELPQQSTLLFEVDVDNNPTASPKLVTARFRIYYKLPGRNI